MRIPVTCFSGVIQRIGVIQHAEIAIRPGKRRVVPRLLVFGYLYCARDFFHAGAYTDFKLGKDRVLDLHQDGIRFGVYRRQFCQECSEQYRNYENAFTHSRFCRHPALPCDRPLFQDRSTIRGCHPAT